MSTTETHYFAGSQGTTITIVQTGEAFTAPGGQVEVTLAAYNTANDLRDAQAAQLEFDNARATLTILVARSAERVNAGGLDSEVLDVGKAYAVYLPDSLTLTITKVVYSLDAVPHHTEFSAPWDYDGTAFGGEANRVTFVAGQHTIDAEVTDAQGTFVVSAVFEVE